MPNAIRQSLLFVLVVAVAMIGLLAAPASAATSRPVKGGALELAHPTEPQTMDAARLTVSWNSVGPAAFAVYDALVVEDTQSYKIVPRVAKSLTTTDGSVWTLTLRPGVKFTDGTNYDAAAVKFNWERQLTVTGAFGRTVVSRIASMEAVNPTTLKVTLTQPDGQFAWSVAYFLNWIASPKAIQEQGANYGSDPTKVVGAGPFTVTSWTRGYGATLTRNPNYWDAPKPYISTLNIRWLTDPSTRKNEFVTGAATVAGAEAAADAASELSSVQGADAARIDLLVRPIIRLNNTKAPFNDVRVRTALNMAFNPKQLNQVAYGGLGTIQDGIMDKRSPFYEPSLKLPGYDQKKAQSLLDEYARDTGHPAEFEILAAPQTQPFAEALQAMLAGYQNLKVTVATTTDIAGRTNSGNWQAIPGGAFSSDNPATNMGTYLDSSNGVLTGGYSNPTVDKAFAEGRAQSDEKDRRPAYRTLQQQLLKDLPVVFLPVNAPVTPIVYKASALKGVTTVLHGIDYANVWLANKK